MANVTPDGDPTSPPKLISQQSTSPRNRENNGSLVPCKRNKSPYATSTDYNKIGLSLRDSRYKAIIWKHAEILDGATASDRQIKTDKIRPQAIRALCDVNSAGGCLLKPGSWGRWTNLSEDEFKEEAIKKIISHLRIRVLSMRKETSSEKRRIAVGIAVHLRKEREQKRRRSQVLGERNVFNWEGDEITDSSDSSDGSDSSDDDSEGDAEEKHKEIALEVEGDEANNNNQDAADTEEVNEDYSLEIVSRKRKAQDLIETLSVGRQAQRRQPAQTRQEEDIAEIDEDEGGSRMRKKQANDNSQDLVENFDLERQIQQQQPSQTRREEDIAETEEDEGGSRRNETQPNNNSQDMVEAVNVVHQAQQQQPAQTCQEHNTLPIEQAVNPLAPIKREEDGGNEPHANIAEHPTLGEVDMLDQSEDPQADDSDGPATDTNAEHTDRASSSYTTEMNEVELGHLYNIIKRKLAASSKSRDEKKFYGHLKKYFSRKIRHGDLLSLSDVNKIKIFISRFESNIKLLDDRGNDWDDICVYGGFIKHIVKECEKELALTDV